MKTIECVVCGEHIVPKSDVDAAEHIALKHPEVKAKIHAALTEALADPVVKQKFAEVGFELVANTPEQFTAYQASDKA